MKSFRFVRDANAGPHKASWRHLVFVVAVGVVVVAIGPTSTPSGADTSTVNTWIVSDLNGVGAALAQLVVQTVGGKVLATLGSADAVEATLTGAESATLSLLPGVVLTPNVGISLTSVESPGAPSRPPSAVFTSQSGATQLWSGGDTGQGVTVAVLDTGIATLPDFGSRLAGGVDLTGENAPFTDNYGHGTFVAGLIASSGSSSAGRYVGEAPGAGLVSVKVADANGETNLVTVIEGIDWTIAHAAALHIRVLNLSLGFVPFTSVLLNPLDLAVQTAWNDGIVVVVSAGNAGPFNGTILSPGDDPYVITVGAVDDQGSASASSDVMASFSSVGPTDPDGFYKPDLAASGRSVVSLAAPGSTVYDENPSARVGSANFVGSGTSFSAAVTSGAVALDLEMHPTDTPDDVKARLLATASPGPSGDPFVDGHGVLNIAAAVRNNGVHLAQNDGSLHLSGSMQGNLQIEPRDGLEAGYEFAMPGSHAASSVRLIDPRVTIPLSCSAGGPDVGVAAIQLSGGPYFVATNDNSDLPSNSSSAGASFQGSISAPNLCGGAIMFGASATLSGELTSTDTTSSVLLAFHYADATQVKGAGWSGAVTTVPVAPVSSGTTVPLSTRWILSTWDGSNWSGLTSTPLTGSAPTETGTAWNGTAWNGTAWNGTAWNGTAWNGTAWNGTAWNGTAWNGTAWNGTAWNGAAWNGTAWNGSAWN